MVSIRKTLNSTLGQTPAFPTDVFRGFIVSVQRNS